MSSPSGWKNHCGHARRRGEFVRKSGSSAGTAWRGGDEFARSPLGGVPKADRLRAFGVRTTWDRASSRTRIAHATDFVTRELLETRRWEPGAYPPLLASAAGPARPPVA